MSVNFKWPYPEHGAYSLGYRLCSRGTILIVSLAGKLWLGYCNNLGIYNKQVLTDAILNRPRGQPLITVGNHMSCMDDPPLFAAALDWSQILRSTSKSHRWTITAADVTFSNALHSYLVTLGRGVPVIRGDGVYQRGMDFAIDKLNSGEWVHTFPEGRVRFGTEYIRLKWGVGRLIEECKQHPLVVPFYHLGMDKVLPGTPQKSEIIPRVGKKITMCVGEPMDFMELLFNMRSENKTKVEIRKAITDIIQDEFARLKEKAEKLHFSSTIS